MEEEEVKKLEGKKEEEEEGGKINGIRMGKIEGGKPMGCVIREGWSRCPSNHTVR